MKIVKCRTSDEVYSALKSGDTPHIVEGSFSIEISEGSPTLIVSGYASPHIACVGYSFPLIGCWGDSTPRVECLDSSTPRIVCSDTSAPTIMCNDTSSPKVEAKGNSHIRILYGSPHITATPSVQVSVLRGTSTIVGTTQIFRVTEDTPEAWCQFYDVPIQEDGTVILYKALNEDYKATRNDFEYLPGSCPVAPDWDPEIECGGGLHFSPNPIEALAFNPWARHLVACPILLSEIKTHILSGVIPEKVKAPRVFKPCYEVDSEGKALDGRLS
jgi:hypothetical protein